MHFAEARGTGELFSVSAMYISPKLFKPASHASFVGKSIVPAVTMPPAATDIQMKIHMPACQHAALCPIKSATTTEITMVRLKAQGSDAAWLDIPPGARIQVRPYTVAAIIAARAEASKVFREHGGEADDDTRDRAGLAMVGALARFAIVAWEGVGDASGELAPVTPENVDALMRVWPAYDAFDRLYVAPALNGETEKNGSTPLLNGTLAAA